MVRKRGAKLKGHPGTLKQIILNCKFQHHEGPISAPKKLIFRATRFQHHLYYYTVKCLTKLYQKRRFQTNERTLASYDHSSNWELKGKNRFGPKEQRNKILNGWTNLSILAGDVMNSGDWDGRRTKETWSKSYSFNGKVTGVLWWSRQIEKKSMKILKTKRKSFSRNWERKYSTARIRKKFLI